MANVIDSTVLSLGYIYSQIIFVIAYRYGHDAKPYEENVAKSAAQKTKQEIPNDHAIMLEPVAKHEDYSPRHHKPRTDTRPAFFKLIPILLSSISY